MKLYFLTGLPTETDEDTLGIAELARNCVEIGKRHTGGASVTAIRRRVRAEAAHARSSGSARTRSPNCSARSTLLRDAHAARPRASTSSGTTRGRRWSRASPAGAIAASGAVIERVWRDGGTFQEWGEHFDLDRWSEAMAAEGLSLDWYVHRHRSEHEVLPWDHLSAGLHKDFLWQRLAGGPRGESASRTAAGRRATTAGCAPATASSTSSPRRVPPAGGSQGTARTSPRRRDRRVQVHARSRSRVATGER